MPHKFTPNSYRIEGDVAYIELTRHDKTIRAVAMIDVEDLERVISHRRWHANWSAFTNSFYCGCNYPRTALHRFILSAPDDMEVDHDNHDTLDCRKQNIRLCTHSENQQNRGNLPPGKSGFRNVVWDKSRQSWRVLIQINGKGHHFGYFKDVAEAGLVAERERKLLHGDFAT